MITANVEISNGRRVPAVCFQVNELMELGINYLAQLRGRSLSIRCPSCFSGNQNLGNQEFRISDKELAGAHPPV